MSGGSSSSGSLSSSGSSDFNVGLLVPIIGTTILLLVGGMSCCWMHRQWKKSGRKGEDPNSYRNHTLTISVSQPDQSSDIIDVVSSRTMQSVRQTSGEDTVNDRSVRRRDSYELGSDSGPNYISTILQEDRRLARKRIPYEEVKLRARLGKSQTREVRLGEYENQQVVIKRLLKTKRSQILHIHEFVYQIQLRSTLDHPNIVALVGVAWTSMADVMVVVEHLPRGDLESYLDLLWDSGFAVTSTNETKQIKTLNGLSMAEIALTLEEYEATTCTAFDCTQPDGTMSYNNNQCTGTNMLTGVKCVAEEFDMTDLNLAMWSVGGDSSTNPEIELVKHTWPDGSSGIKYKVYAVHTQSLSSERTYGGCPSTESYGYLNIPCYGADDVPSSYEVTEPTPTDWVTSWMETYSTGSSDPSRSSSVSGTSSQAADDSGSSSTGEHTGTNVALLGGAVGGGLGLLLVAVLLGLFIAGRRRKRSDSDNERSPKVVEYVETISPHGDYERRPTVSTHPRSTLDDSQPRSGVSLPSSDDSWPNPGPDRDVRPQQQRHGRTPSPAAQPPLYDGNSRRDFAARPPRHSVPGQTVQSMSYQENTRAFGSDVAAPPPYEEAVRSSALLPVSVAKIRGLGPENALRVLAADPNVDRRRIRLDELQVERQLPMTTLQTDSYIARYKGQQVLVKRLAPGQAINVPAVEDLAVEIQQRSHLKHPNLVQFVCAGWTSALDLAMGVEFLAQGSLRTYLDRNTSSMRTWTPQKTSITAGIARALAYLHRQIPAYIHRELCAKNVLLTDKLEAKLANCGSTDTNSSIGRQQRNRLAFWIAPEVLQGAPYSPAADIFSFGVLLAELDTCESPYYDARSPDGSTLDQEAVLAIVAEGRLRPSFSAECPTFIRQLGVACCQQDPEKRLTAQQIVQLLEGK
ncbi:hypothetical protein PRIC2_010061 [Phytophthora ramorum]